MKQVELTEKLKLEQVIRQARQQDIVLTRGGRAVAVISGIDDEDLYWYASEKDPKFLASLRRARKQVKQGKTVRHEDLKRELGIEA